MQHFRFNLYQLPIKQTMVTSTHLKHCFSNFSILPAFSHFKGASTEASSGQYHRTKMPPTPEALDVIFEERINATALEASPREKGSAAVLQGAAWPGFPCRVHIGATFLFRSLEPSVQCPIFAAPRNIWLQQQSLFACACPLLGRQASSALMHLGFARWKLEGDVSQGCS